MTNPIDPGLRLNLAEALDAIAADIRHLYGDGAYNQARAKSAAVALCAYMAATRGRRFPDHEDDIQEAFSDLLGDLRHLSDAIAVSYDHLDERGEGHYRVEVIEDTHPA